jgi:hypothetical protein
MQTARSFLRSTSSVTQRRPSAFTLVEVVVLLVLLVLLGVLIAWGVRRTNRVASLKALRDIGIDVQTTAEDELEGIRFTNCFLGDDVMLTHVANLGTFKNLIVCNTDVSDVGLRAVPDPAALVNLDLTLTGISDDSLKFIGENCTNLETLTLIATLITDDGIAHLVKLPKLKKLNLAECRITDESLTHLVKMKSLTHLNLSYTCLSGEKLEDLPRHETLKELKFSGMVDALGETRVWRLFPNSILGILVSDVRVRATLNTSTPFAHVRVISYPQRAMENRFYLKSQSTPVSNRRIVVEIPAVEFVQKAGGDAYGNLHITRVNLTGADVSDEDVKLLYPLRMVSNLQLSDTAITDQFSEHLAGFRHLTVLQLSKTAVADETARVLPRLPLLRELDLRHTKITDEGMKHISTWNQLLILDVSDTAITDKAIESLFLMDKMFEMIETLPGPAGLRVLGLSGTKITDASIDYLVASPTLQEISVGRTGLSEEGLARLRKEFKGKVRLEFLKFHPAWPVDRSE